MSLETEEEPRVAVPTRLIAAVFAGLVVVLAGWYFLVLRQNYAVLYNDLRPEDAAVVVEALQKQGVPYRLGAGGAEIRVPASRLDQARLDLTSSGATIGATDGFELFNESDMGLTDFAQKIRYQRALQGELARTIMLMEGVADARVHISMPERTLFRGERRSAEAAVTLVMRASEDETPARIEGVQRLVAASVPDLQVSDVVLLNARGEIISPRVEISDTILRGRAGADVNAPSIDAVMDIMRRALPVHRFEVTIETAPSPLAGGDESEDGSPLRVVTVTTEARLSDAEMEGVSQALRDGGIVDGASGGTLAFRLGPPTMFEALPSADVRASAQPTLEVERDAVTALAPWLGWLALPIALGALIGGWAWFNRAKLSSAEHDDFATQLKAALQSRQAEAGRG
jgi:flagellar M-ring protein FliF